MGDNRLIKVTKNGKPGLQKAGAKVEHERYVRRTDTLDKMQDTVL